MVANTGFNCLVIQPVSPPSNNISLRVSLPVWLVCMSPHRYLMHANALSSAAISIRSYSLLLTCICITVPTIETAIICKSCLNAQKQSRILWFDHDVWSAPLHHTFPRSQNGRIQECWLLHMAKQIKHQHPPLWLKNESCD